MQTIEVNKGIHIGFEDIMKGIQKLDNQSLANFANEINLLVSNRIQQPNNKDAELLRKIKNSVPITMKRRQKQLYTKLQEETISLKETEELQLLNDMIEEKIAERIILMGELAQLRHVTLQQLSAELDF
jgi:hypothetical protein